MEKELAWGRDKPGDDDMLLSAESDTEAYHGRLARARELTEQAVKSALAADSRESAGLWEVNLALQDAEFGNTSEARRLADAALHLSAGRDVRMFATLAFARAGAPERSTAIYKALKKSAGSNTVLTRYWLPSIAAAIELARGNPAGAVEALDSSRPYELGVTYNSLGNLYVVYLRGEAYLRLRDGRSAAIEFEKYKEHSGTVFNSPLAALAYLQLARANVMQGDAGAAETNYARFFRSGRKPMQEYSS